MSKNDMHPAMAEVAQEDGNPNISNEDFITAQQLKMVVVGPQYRTAAIRQVDQALADSSTTLRSRAQLLNLKRRMSTTHNALLKAGR